VLTCAFENEMEKDGNKNKKLKEMVYLNFNMSLDRKI
jgi:hypothetical protein